MVIAIIQWTVKMKDDSTTDISRKCCVCGKSMKGCLHILMGEGKTKHAWCKSDDVSKKT